METNMSIKEFLEKYYDNDYTNYEIYAYNSATYERLHSDFIKWIEPDNKGINKKLKKIDWYSMDEEEYHDTIEANVYPQTDFEDEYGDKNAKMLIIVISYEDYLKLEEN